MELADKEEVPMRHLDVFDEVRICETSHTKDKPVSTWEHDKQSSAAGGKAVTGLESFLKIYNYECQRRQLRTHNGYMHMDAPKQKPNVPDYPPICRWCYRCLIPKK